MANSSIMILNQKANLKYYCSKELKHVPHGFFTRHGGVSLAPFDSLNFAKEGGDDWNNIIANKKIVLDAFNRPFGKLLTLTQVHGTKIIKVKNSGDLWDSFTRNAPEADAIILTMPEILIGIKTADCQPILIATSDGSIVSAVHGGWRSIFDGIVEEVVNELQTMTIKPLIACIGPCIHADSYEMGPEVYTQFTQKNHYWDKFFQIKESSILFDLKGLTTAILYSCGVKVVDEIPCNTYKSPQDFFSHRFATHNKMKRGVQISVIGRS